MTLRKKLEEAAFWDGWVCLACGATDEEGGECPDCGRDGMVEARAQVRFLALIEGDEE